MPSAVGLPAPADHKTKPSKPDEESFKVDLVEAEKNHAAVQEKLNQIKARIEDAKPNNQDSPAAKRQKELRAELASIRQKQQAFRTSRTATQEKIAALDASLKARIAEQNSSRSRISFKNVDEVDKEIERLEKQVDSGKMRLVEERDALAEISRLRRQRKNFAGLDELQKVINGLKAQISELKKTLDSAETKALSEKYAGIQKELDAIKEEQDNAFKGLNALRDERTKLHEEQHKALSAVKEIKDSYYGQRKAWKEYEDEAWRIRRERQKAEREAIERERRRKIADKKLEEASRPAYTDEILIAQGLIRHFDSSYEFSVLGLDKDKKSQTGNFRAEVGRTVDDSNIKGIRVIKKDEREDDYFVGTGGKKGKKNRRGVNGSPAPGTTVEGGKFNLSFGVIEDFAKVKVDPPMNQTGVPAAIDKLAEKIAIWKKDQDTKTNENIKKVQEEIDQLEKESQRPTNQYKSRGGGASEGSGDHSPPHTEPEENHGVDDAPEELKKAAIED